jgi:ABC-2 type transport system ATP-binding protein
VTAPVASVAALVKRFGEGPPALGGVTLAVAPGETLGLVGPDGAGKSTLLKLLAGIGSPDSGSIDIAPEVRARLSFMPQSAGLYDDLSVAENMALYADLRGGADAGAQAETLAIAGLAPFAARLAGQLSGGMRQKLGLACALVTRPALVLLDEPSVGVDPVSRAELWDLVRRLAGEGTAIIWATSNLDEAERCDRVALLHEGQMIAEGPPAALSARMAGQVWRIAIDGTRARRVLAAALAAPDVIDATVQGASVRVVVRPGGADPLQGALAQINPRPLAAVPPRLEDSFIAALGGARLAPSPLTSAYRTIGPQDGAMIAAEGLVRRFGDFTAVDGVSLSVARGEIFGLLGPNGAGKTTSFRMLCGLIGATSGTARVAGLDMARQRSAAHEQLGYMAQKFSLYATLTVEQNLQFFAGAYGLAGARRRSAVADALAMFGLEPMAERSAGEIPPGFRQRLSLACAIMHQPPVLFLDEPTSGVDPLTRREFWSHINAMAERGVTIFVTTHFMDEAEYCDRIALIYRGRMIAEGTPDALKAAQGSDSLEAAFFALLAPEQAGLAA